MAVLAFASQVVYVASGSSAFVALTFSGSPSTNTSGRCRVAFAPRSESRDFASVRGQS